MGNVIDDGIFCTWWTLWSLMKCVCLHILSGKSCLLQMNGWMDSKAPAGWVFQWLSTSWRLQIDRPVHWDLLTLIQYFSHGYMGRNDSQTKHTNEKKIRTKATTCRARRCRTSLSRGSFYFVSCCGLVQVSSTSTQAGNSLHRLDVAHRGETVPGRNSRQWMGVQVWRQCLQCLVSVSLEGTNIQRFSSRLRVGPFRYSRGCLWPAWRRRRTPPAGRPGRSDRPGDPAPWPSHGQRWGWDRCFLLPRTGSGRCGYSVPWRTWGRDTDSVITTMARGVPILK